MSAKRIHAHTCMSVALQSLREFSHAAGTKSLADDPEMQMASYLAMQCARVFEAFIDRRCPPVRGKVTSIKRTAKMGFAPSDGSRDAWKALVKEHVTFYDSPSTAIPPDRAAFDDTQRATIAEATHILHKGMNIGRNPRRIRISLQRWSERDRLIVLLTRLQMVTDDIHAMADDHQQNAPPLDETLLVGDEHIDINNADQREYFSRSSTRIDGPDVRLPLQLLVRAARFVQKQLPIDQRIHLDGRQTRHLHNCAEAIAVISVGGDAVLPLPTEAQVAPVIALDASGAKVADSTARYLSAVRQITDAALGTNLQHVIQTQDREDPTHQNGFVANGIANQPTEVATADLPEVNMPGEKIQRRHRTVLNDMRHSGAGVLFTVCSPYAVQQRQHLDGPSASAVHAAFPAEAMVE